MFFEFHFLLIFLAIHLIEIDTPYCATCNSWRCGPVCHKYNILMFFPTFYIVSYLFWGGFFSWNWIPSASVYMGQMMVVILICYHWNSNFHNRIYGYRISFHRGGFFMVRSNYLSSISIVCLINFSKFSMNVPFRTNSFLTLFFNFRRNVVINTLLSQSIYFACCRNYIAYLAINFVR